MKVMSLFSGIGGFDYAFQRKGHEIVGACEIDRYARQVYARHFPDVRLYKDATKINAEKLPDFDILVAGFPCQPFSIAGKRKGFGDTRGTLFFEIARITSAKRPRHLLLENVKGLLSHESGDTIRKIYKTLDELGYDTESHIINTKDFLPQNRERIFIIGTLRGRGERRREIFSVREDIKIHDKKQKPTTVRAITGGGHSGGHHSQMTMICINTDLHQHNRIYDPKGIASTLNANGGGLGAKTGLYAMLTERRTEKAKEIRRQSRKQGGRDFSPRREKELVPRNDALANCLTSGQSMEGFLSNGKRIRRLTPTECCRLQGFDDDWVDELSDTQRYKCLGNAVTVPVIEYILERLE